jgi:hypothetical protein
MYRKYPELLKEITPSITRAAVMLNLEQSPQAEIRLAGPYTWHDSDAARCPLREAISARSHCLPDFAYCEPFATLRIALNTRPYWSISCYPAERGQSEASLLCPDSPIAILI